MDVPENGFGTVAILFGLVFSLVVSQMFPISAGQKLDGEFSDVSFAITGMT